MNIVIIGYYGVANLGDDLMLDNLLRFLGFRSDVGHITVFCVENYYKSYCKTSFIESRSWNKPAKLLAVMRADAVFWGGGACLYERNDDNRGLSGLLRLQRLCRLLHTKFLFLSIGVGDIF